MPMSVTAVDIDGNPDPTGAGLAIIGGATINGVAIATQTDIAAVNAEIAAITPGPPAFTLPGTEGTSGQVIESNGDGTSGWGTPALPSAPTMQVFLSGSGTYTKPAGVNWIRVRGPGGGAGGYGSGTSAGTAPGPGGDTTFGSVITAKGGAIGSWTTGAGGAGGSGGTAPTGSLVVSGGMGGPALCTNGAIGAMGGNGGNSALGGGGAGGTFNESDVATVGNAGAPNTGAGGAGAGSLVAGIPGPGGGAGELIDTIIVNPLATYSYSIGAGGAAGAAGAGSGLAGGAGGSGGLWVEEHYGS